MRFELSVALKYLIPRFRQLSVSLISLVSVLVISLVVWLVIVFLSVTDGIERKWIEELVALNAPLRMTPTEAYYKSYYYQIDQVSYDSSYTHKTIGEKLRAPATDPYDPTFDAELPYDFPDPARTSDGSVRDLVKEAWSVVTAEGRFPGVRPQEYEVTFGNLRLNVVHDNEQTFVNQASYITSHDGHNQRFSKLLLEPTADDYNNLLAHISDPNNREESLAPFFENIEVKAFKVGKGGYRLPRALYPKGGSVKAVGLMAGDKVRKVVIPESAAGAKALQEKWGGVVGELAFHDGSASFEADGKAFRRLQIYLEEGFKVPGRVVVEVAPQLLVEGKIQGLPFGGEASLDGLEIADAKVGKAGEAHPPFWAYKKEEGASVIPSGNALGEGVLLSKSFRENGVHLGDQGYLAYYSPTASAMQEQRIPVYVAGFYDPGFMPVGNRMVIVDPTITATLRGNLTVSDAMLGNGVNLWTPRIEDAESAKGEIQKALDERGLGAYWKVQSYSDYEFAKPVLQQLQSDKTLFTLIAVIILIVACSNIISMLILLVNDKKREIGIMQSMGASPMRIATIFGLCGFLTGLVSSVIGTLAALLTLHNLQALVRFLSFLQGHEAFQAAFYGSVLPSDLSPGALIFVLSATTLISVVAGLAPAIKAARIRPTEILRAE